MGEAVVITPEFGRKTEAQRESDERWFAAMRNDDRFEAHQVEQASSRSLELPEVMEREKPRNRSAQAVEDGEQIKPAESGSPVEPVRSQKSTEAPLKVDGNTGQASDQAPAEASPSEHAAASVRGADPGPAPTPESGGQAKAASIGAESVEARSSREPMSVKRRIALVIAAVVVVAIAAATIAFTWNRWYRFDDRADIQGEWYVVGTTVPVTIDESSIHLTDDVTYQYEINPQDKTIRYTFGRMEGQGRYWFSDDRQYLVITDGDEYTSTGTAFEDLMQTFVDLSNRATGNETKLPEGEGIIAFSREPDKEALAKQEAEAEAKKKAEEAARKEAERKAAEEAAAAAAEAEYYEESPEEEAPAEGAPAEGAPAEDAPAEEEPQEREEPQGE